MKGRPLLWVIYIGIMIVLAEGTAQVALRVLTGSWPVSDRGGKNAGLFEAHPYLVGAPRAGASVTRGAVTVSINQKGYRGAEILEHRDSTVLRVLALGGSTTFGNFVDDKDTWPVSLQHALDSAMSGTSARWKSAEVINGGVPGYTSAENLIELSLRGLELKPDVVILFQGLNDLRNSNAPGLRSDYSNFHAPSQIGNLELDRLARGNRIALVRLGSTAMKVVFGRRRSSGESGARSDAADPVAESHFGSNLHSFAGVCRAHNLRCIFVPQVGTTEYPVDEWWFRYLKPEGYAAGLQRYNAVMENTAASTATPFVRAVTDAQWTRDDFVDFCHFSGRGGRKFAALVVPAVIQHASGN